VPYMRQGVVAPSLFGHVPSGSGADRVGSQTIDPGSHMGGDVGPGFEEHEGRAVVSRVIEQDKTRVDGA
jgi:hypothetical protein